MDTTHFLFGVKILLVEDNAINKAIFKTCLNKQGCVFFEVSNGEEALNFLKQERVDIIIMDIQMPLMDGIQTTKLIRNQLKLGTPIIALTASINRKEIDYFISIGMNDFINKPFDSEKINSILSQYLPQKKDVVTELNTNGKNYSLHYLIQITHGDKVLINEITTLFCEHIPNEVEQIRKAYQEQNIVLLKKLVHKIKPNINNFKIEKLYEIISLLDNITEVDDLKSSAIAESITILEEIINEVVDELKEQLN
jgi:CheY-like chemotaxis protein